MDPDESSLNIGETTLLKLAESINQYAATSLSTIQIPEFKGMPDEDIHVFMRKFKLSTLTLNDRLKCLALQKALSGAAHIWAKTSIKSMLNDGNWLGAKKALIGRFSAPDRDLRNKEKLSKLKYDKNKGTLVSYVEEYADCYRKAHNKASDTDIIQNLRLNLPHDIIRHLNLLSDDWVSSKSLPDFLSLIKRLETKILPFKTDEERSRDKSTSTEVLKMLKELQETLKSRPDKVEQVETKAIAAFETNPSNQREFPANQGGKVNDQMNFRDQFNHQTGWRGQQQRFNNGRQRPYLRQNDNPRYSFQAPKNNNFRQPKPEEDKRKATYESKFGIPPGPCQLCQGYHFNRHCPLYNLN